MRNLRLAPSGIGEQIIEEWYDLEVETQNHSWKLTPVNEARSWSPNRDLLNPVYVLTRQGDPFHLTRPHGVFEVLWGIFISFLPPEVLPCPLDCDGSPAPCPIVLRFISCAICIKRWLIAPCPTSNCATGSPTLCCGGGGGIGAWAGIGLWPGFSQGILPEEIPKTAEIEPKDQ